MNKIGIVGTGTLTGDTQNPIYHEIEFTKGRTIKVTQEDVSIAAAQLGISEEDVLERIREAYKPPIELLEIKMAPSIVDKSLKPTSLSPKLEDQPWSRGYKRNENRHSKKKRR